LPFRILVVNPGSTSTKLSIYEDRTAGVTETISHDAPTIAQFASLMDQLPMRLAIVKDFLVRHNLSPQGRIVSMRQWWTICSTRPWARMHRTLVLA
jgi:butyrate kinase